MSYEDLADVLAGLQTDHGGTPEQRNASAHLFVALCHHAFVELVRVLKRADIDAQAGEPPGVVALIVGPVAVKVIRVPGTFRVMFEFLGFDSSIIPFDKTRQTKDMTAASIEEVERLAKQFVDGIGSLLKRDRAVKQGVR
ncbi:MAG TPA: hypothetical protein VHE35_17425 [Kofleriaceae bacterium]|nr:hypothetical protein [Kofleriaceae bacterium]